MAQIVASIKIFPEDIIISKEELKEAVGKALPDGISLHRIDEEPIAFGLVALLAHVILPEKENELEKVEEILRKVKGVSNVETILVRRI